jgi:HEAT repeat protein
MLRENSTYLRDLYSSVKSAGLREQIVNGIVQIGGTENAKWLLDVAANSKETASVRRTALYATGVLGDDDSGNASNTPRNRGCYPNDEHHTVPIKSLVKLYSAIQDYSIREQLLYAYARRAKTENEAMTVLISVAKKDSNPQLRQRAVFWLSQLKDQRATEALSEIITR